MDRFPWSLPSNAHSLWSQNTISVLIGIERTFRSRDALLINSMFSFSLPDSPRSYHLLHFLSWILALTGMFFILAGHQHYSIDILIAWVLTSRLFIYYHTWVPVNPSSSFGKETLFPLRLVWRTIERFSNAIRTEWGSGFHSSLTSKRTSNKLSRMNIVCRVFSTKLGLNSPGVQIECGTRRIDGFVLATVFLARHPDYKQSFVLRTDKLIRLFHFSSSSMRASRFPFLCTSSIDEWNTRTQTVSVCACVFSLSSPLSMPVLTSHIVHLEIQFTSISHFLPLHALPHSFKIVSHFSSEKFFLSPTRTAHFSKYWCQMLNERSRSSNIVQFVLLAYFSTSLSLSRSSTFVEVKLSVLFLEIIFDHLCKPESKEELDSIILRGKSNSIHIYFFFVLSE